MRRLRSTDPDPGETGGLVVLVEDDPAARDSLAMLLEAAGHRPVAFGSAAALLAAGVPAGAACLVVDVHLGEEPDGILLVEALRRRGDRTPVVVVTGHGDIPLAVRAMRAGAADFVEKPYSRDRLLAAIDEARQAGAGPARAAALLARLTPREREVLAGLVRGQANKLVAADLGISIRTVEGYRAVIMEKLEARSLSDAVRLALLAGLE
jgi:two-component system response regulator FixJ